MVLAEDAAAAAALLVTRENETGNDEIWLGALCIGCAVFLSPARERSTAASKTAPKNLAGIQILPDPSGKAGIPDISDFSRR